MICDPGQSMDVCEKQKKKPWMIGSSQQPPSFLLSLKVFRLHFNAKQGILNSLAAHSLFKRKLRLDLHTSKWHISLLSQLRMSERQHFSINRNIFHCKMAATLRLVLSYKSTPWSILVESQTIRSY